MTRVSGIAGAIAIALTACSSTPPSAPGPPPASVGHPLTHALPDTVTKIALTDSTGHPFRLADLRGKIVVVSDMLTLCQETCPLDTAQLVAAGRAVTHAGLGGRVEFLSITVDPQRDTPARLRAYRSLFEPAPMDWRLVTGTPTALAALWKQLGVYVARTPEAAPAGVDWVTGKALTYDVSHTDAVFFLDAALTERFLLLGSPHLAAGAILPAALERFLNAEGRSNAAHPAATAWTLDDELSVLSWLTGKTITP